MITIRKPGLLSSIQDLGRYGFQKYGVIASGTMDSTAHRIANLLVGNPENTPTLEMTLIGPVIQFHQDTLIAICGGDLSPTIHDIPVPSWRTIYVRKDTVLQFGTAHTGCRAYLAIAGGFSIPKILNSTSTYLRAQIGGFLGRALITGDQVSLDAPNELSLKMMKQLNLRVGNHAFTATDWFIVSDFLPNLNSKTFIRVMSGRHYQLFSKDSQEKIFSEPFTITAQSDRMGYRLHGPTLRLTKAQEITSEAVTFGTIQVPADGHPIILLADRQTTGGYPKIGQIASVDLSLIAQAKPGDELYFMQISHEEAQRLYLEREIKINLLKHGILHKFF